MTAASRRLTIARLIRAIGLLVALAACNSLTGVEDLHVQEAPACLATGTECVANAECCSSSKGGACANTATNGNRCVDSCTQNSECTPSHCCAPLKSGGKVCNSLAFCAECKKLAATCEDGGDCCDSQFGTTRCVGTDSGGYFCRRGCLTNLECGGNCCVKFPDSQDGWCNPATNCK